MKDTILLGREKKLVATSWEFWRQRLAGASEHMNERLSFMTPEHHLVRDTAVSELVRNSGKPLEAQFLSRLLGLPRSRVEEILDELEKGLFFLVRNEKREITWAFPVTSDRTPHQLVLSTGERVFSA